MSRKLRPTAVLTAEGIDHYREMFSVTEDDPGSTLPEQLPAHTVGWDVLAWIEGNLVDPATGDPWRLTREQCRTVLWWYAYDPATLRPLYLRGEIVRMKGAGKSPFAAVLVLVEACGPCRPGPHGAVPATSPYIPVAGVSEDNAESCMEFVRLLAKHSTLPFDVGLGRVVTPAGSIIEPITSSPWTAEGRRPTLVIVEESQHLTSANQGRSLYRVLQRNAAKGADGWSRVLSVTNRHTPGSESVAEVNAEAHQAQLPGLLYDCREGPQVDDLLDRDAVVAAVRTAAGDAWWVPVDRIADEAPTTDPAVFTQYYLNRVSHAVDAWIDAAAWDRNVMHREITTTEPIVLAFDGSTGRTNGTLADATALVGCTMSGHLFLCGLWGPKPGAYDWTPPVEEILETVAGWLDQYNVVGFGADPAGWEGIVAGWEAQYGDRLKVKAGTGSPIAYRFNRTGIVARDVEALRSAIVTGSVTVAHQAGLRAHALNARVKAGPQGAQLRKETNDGKIDAVVAAVMAHALMLEARRTGVDKPPAPQFAPRRIR